jgi:hypothetical protein
MICIPISTGELIDKISILQIKRGKVKNIEKLQNVNKELDELLKIAKKFISQPLICDVYQELLNVNLELWECNERRRKLEKRKNFGDEFIDVVRKSYNLYDKRFEKKKIINSLTNSDIIEVKEYV